jgi:hypothetical protein
LASERGLLSVLLLVRSWAGLNRAAGAARTTKSGKERSTPEILRDEVAFLPDAAYFFSYVPEGVYMFPGVGVYRACFRTPTGLVTDQRLISGLMMSTQRWLEVVGSEPQFESTLQRQELRIKEYIAEVPFYLFLPSAIAPGSVFTYLRSALTDAIVQPHLQIIHSLFEACREGHFRDSTVPLRVLTSTTDPEVHSCILLESEYLGPNGRYLDPIPGIRKIREGLTRVLPMKLREPEVLLLTKYRIGQIAQEFADVGYPALRGHLRSSP